MDRRTVLAIVACLGVLIGFSWVSNKLYPPPQRPSAPAQTARGSEREAPSAGSDAKSLTETAQALPATDGGAGSKPEPAAPEPPLAGHAAKPLEAPAKTFDAKLGALGCRFDTVGAKLVRLVPGDYKDFDARTPLDLLKVFREQTESALSVRVQESATNLAGIAWRVVEESPRAIVFEQRTGDGITVRKRFAAVDQSPYALSLTLSFTNEGSDDRVFGYELDIATGIRPEEPNKRELTYAIAGVAPEQNVELESTLASKLPKFGEEKPEKLSGAVRFGGVASKYFTIALMPDEEHPAHALSFFRRVGVLDGARGAFEASVPGATWSVTQIPLGRGETLEHSYTMYAGPKRKEDVAAFAQRGLPAVLKVSSYVPLASTLSGFFLTVLEWLHTVVPSYGLAIILLTLMVRGALHPMSKTSQRSTYKMQQLAPLVNEIRERYKDKTSREQQQQMNMEIMELYKKHGASPLAGCLPMLFQLPVFIGLYNALAYDIELRQTQFLYIRDLSKPDRLYDFGVAAPWPVEGYLNLLPILMVVMMIVQQRLMPKPSDPQQQSTAKVMQFVMVIFGVMFYTVPSGLVLYFLTSSLVGTLETRWIRRQLQLEAAEAKAAAPAKAPKLTREPKKSRRIKGSTQKREKKKKFV